MCWRTRLDSRWNLISGAHNVTVCRVTSQNLGLREKTELRLWVAQPRKVSDTGTSPRNTECTLSIRACFPTNSQYIYHKSVRVLTLKIRLAPTTDYILLCPDGEPSDDRRQRRGGADDREPAESRRRTADTDDTVLESHEQSSVASQDQGTTQHNRLSGKPREWYKHIPWRVVCPEEVQEIESPSRLRKCRVHCVLYFNSPKSLTNCWYCCRQWP